MDHRPSLPPLPVHPGDETCFGCGAENGAGLQMTFSRTGAHGVESELAIPAYLRGGPTVAHGGIQATILDEVMGKAVHTAFPLDFPRRIVTAEMSVRYRRPVPIEIPILARAEMVRVEGDDVHVRAELVSTDGMVYTTAHARWRALPPS